MQNKYPIWASSSRAAGMFGVSAATVRRWAKEGKITSMRTPGGAFRYDVAPWMPENAAPPVKAPAKARKPKAVKVETSAEVKAPVESVVPVVETPRVVIPPAPVMPMMDPAALKSVVEQFMAGAK